MGAFIFMIQDKQEGAQWFAAPATIRNIIEACLSRVSSLKGQALIIQHMTMYDGVFEKVGSFLIQKPNMLTMGFGDVVFVKS